MFLQAPKSSQAPKPNRSQKGAFTGKPPAKPKPFKPPGAEAEEAPPPPKVETPFVKWLKDKTTNGSWHVEETKDFLLEGPPYKGSTAWGTRELLDGMGTMWMRNPAKKKDCDDKSIPRGWSCASDEATMLKLLKVTHKGGRAWWCVGLMDTQLIQVQKWVVEFFGGDLIVADEQPVPLEQEEQARKKQRAEDPWKDVPEWIVRANKRWVNKWVPDTICSVCNQGVTDQFLDCHCQEARWQRCPMCMEKWRTDLTDSFEKMANPNSWCKCPKQSSLGQRWQRDHV